MLQLFDRKRRGSDADGQSQANHRHSRPNTRHPSRSDHNLTVESSESLRITKALAESGLAPRRLELEITEAVVMQDDDSASTTLHQLRDLGVRIALDDFGIGYSSLSYLRRFPFDKIKIDRSFVADLGDSDCSAAIVQTVVTIANSRGMVTTAEGVETDEQLRLLTALGCSQVQGWFFKPAMTASDVRALLRPDHETKSMADITHSVLL